MMKVLTLILSISFGALFVLLISAWTLSQFDEIEKLSTQKDDDSFVVLPREPSFFRKLLINIRQYYQSNKDNNNNVGECQVYLAESTVSPRMMGIFTTKPIERQQQVHFKEIAIPVTFPNLKSDRWKVWFDYLWDPVITGMQVPGESDYAIFVPGMGSNVNSNVRDLANLFVIGHAKYDAVGLDQSFDYGSGAFTPYYHVKSNGLSSTENIVAGSELFSHYGNFGEDPPAGNAFRIADQLLLHLANFYRNHQDLPIDIFEHIWKDLIQDFPCRSGGPTCAAIKALPKGTWTELQNDYSLRGSKMLSRDVRRRQHIRPVEWVRQSGYCSDYIRAGPSTIAQAGRGAFLTRFVTKGTRIAFSPLLHIAHEEIFGWSHKDVERELVRNYSFGHDDAPILFTPHAPGVSLINHSNQPNVKLRWPVQQVASHNPIYLTNPLSILKHATRVSLSLEYIAMRDLYPGQELFIDYGPAWESAWNQHVQNWQPRPEAYVDPSQMNTNVPFRTVLEQAHDPYPSNLFLICQASFIQDVAGGEFVYVPPDKDNDMDNKPSKVEWLPCDVIHRTFEPKGGQGRYRVLLEVEDGRPPIVVHHQPSNAIAFDTHPMMSDWAMKNSFRHEMTLPDDLVPDVWRRG